MKTKLLQDLRLFLVGVAMGVANIIPGVSGGTIAVVFGIYEELMEALGNLLTNKEKRREYIRFLVILFLGSLIAVVGLARLLTWCFDNYPLMTVYFFMGLILGSIPVVIRSHKDMKISATRTAALLAGIGVVVWLTILQGDQSAATHKISDFSHYTLINYSYFLLCGILAASAMIIPGVSGSFILILLGVYWTVLGSLSGITELFIENGFSQQVTDRGLILGSLGFGVVIGILGFSKIMSWALKHYPAVTMYSILGLIIGSFYQIYPGFEFSLNGAGAIVTLIIGLVISLKFSKQE
jgi:putative membrane protein